MGFFKKKQGDSASQSTGQYNAPNASSSPSRSQGGNYEMSSSPARHSSPRRTVQQTQPPSSTHESMAVNQPDEYSLMNEQGGGNDGATVQSGESESNFSITRNGQYLTLNGFANGHLMRWKFAAEEGPTIIRIPAILLSIACIVTTLWPIVSMPAYWNVPNLIGAFHTVVLCTLILFLEGRVLMFNRSPLNARARVRGVVTRYLNILRLVWGRGLLYIFAGTMNLTIDFEYVIYTGPALCGLGLIAIAAGARASYNLDRMKSSLTDEAYLWGRFDANDGDKDGQIDVNGFAELLWDLGLEFDDVYTFKAFKQIDKDGSGLISFEDFKRWWIVTQTDARARETV
ncbi:unnamed protein product [Cylindrotheca closterium]|uniref:EF-hand domain-containing protein n=1 Tax=Cylindrotheca closterium TaxID=2856 RepID=A0AAD2FRV1_9STRA|nr:unnamed protein product [Cylindrotheca closterium]